jgi:hypothetical protein
MRCKRRYCRRRSSFCPQNPLKTHRLGTDLGPPETALAPKLFNRQSLAVSAILAISVSPSPVHPRKIRTYTIHPRGWLLLVFRFRRSRGPQASLVLACWGGIPAIGALRAPPLPLLTSSQIGVDLRGAYPRPSQIGVDFSDLASIGAALGFPIPAIPCDDGDSGDLLVKLFLLSKTKVSLFRSEANLQLYHLFAF